MMMKILMIMTILQTRPICVLDGETYSDDEDYDENDDQNYDDDEYDNFCRPDQFVSLMERHKPTFLHLVPPLARFILSSPFL